MPILNVDDEIEIELTHECNWDCRYCAIRTHELPSVSEQDALEKVRRAAGHATVTFSGGEPGMIPRETLEKMLLIAEEAGSDVCVNTNGLLLKKYPDLAPRFKEIIYHCSKDLDDRLTIYDFPNIRYMLVVDDVNFPRLGDYLVRNAGITFDVVPASYEPGDARKSLSMLNRMRIVKAFSDRLTPESQSRLFVDKDFDAVKYL